MLSQGKRFMQHFDIDSQGSLAISIGAVIFSMVISVFEVVLYIPYLQEIAQLVAITAGLNAIYLSRKEHVRQLLKRFYGKGDSDKSDGT
jgi:hypothetical protein